MRLERSVPAEPCVSFPSYLNSILKNVNRNFLISSRLSSTQLRNYFEVQIKIVDCQCKNQVLGGS